MCKKTKDIVTIAMFLKERKICTSLIIDHHFQYPSIVHPCIYPCLSLELTFWLTISYWRNELQEK